LREAWPLLAACRCAGTIAAGCWRVWALTCGLRWRSSTTSHAMTTPRTTSCGADQNVSYCTSGISLEASRTRPMVPIISPVKDQILPLRLSFYDLLTIRCVLRLSVCRYHRQAVVGRLGDATGEVAFVNEVLQQDAKNYHAHSYRYTHTHRPHSCRYIHTDRPHWYHVFCRNERGRACPSHMHEHSPWIDPPTLACAGSIS
jgi:hypothetical protein